MSRRAIALISLALALVACLSVPAASTAFPEVPDGGWYWLYPAPHFPVTTCVETIGDDVWALGDGGGIVHSSDGGRTWQEQSSPVCADFLAVSFCDRLNGWAAGRRPWRMPPSDIIIHTTDGGATWREQVVPIDDDIDWTGLKDIEFVDARHGWAASWMTLLKTTDGGATWAAVLTKDLGIGLVKDLSFVTAGRGWAACTPEGVQRTTDGGATWTDLPGRYLDTVDFVDSDNGWAMQEYSSELFRTSDGGETWAVTGLDGIRDALSMDLVDPDAGFVLARDAIGESSLLATSDGGTTWSAHPIPRSSSAGTFPTDIAARDSLHCWIAGRLTGVAGTMDGGVTWRQVSADPTQSITDLDFFSENRGIATGSRSGTAFVLRTSDGGATWQEQTPADSLRSVSVAGPRTAWALAGPETAPVVMRSTDGGIEWQPCAVLPGPDPAKLIDGIDQSTACVVGVTERTKDGEIYFDTTIYMTSDGGAAWSSVDVADSRVNDVEFGDALHGWLVSGTESGSYGYNYGGRIVTATTDGGRSWSRQLKEYDAAPLMGIDAIDAGEAWAVGGDEDYWGSGEPRGVILHTTDGGVTWTQNAAGSAVRYRDVAFSDHLHGVVTGNFGSHDSSGWGFAMTTADGGATWVTRTLGVHSDPCSIVTFGPGRTFLLDPGPQWPAGGAIAADHLPTPDTAPPAVVVDRIAHVKADGAATIAVRVSDDRSATALVTVAIRRVGPRRGSWSTSATVVADGNSQMVPLPSGLGRGVFRVTVSAADEAGNTAFATQALLLIVAGGIAPNP